MKEMSKYAAKKARQAETGEVGYITVPVAVSVSVTPNVTRSEAQCRTRSDIEPMMREFAALANEATSDLAELHQKLLVNFRAEPDGPFRKVLSHWISMTGQCIKRTSDIRHGTRELRKAFSR